MNLNLKEGVPAVPLPEFSVGCKSEVTRESALKFAAELEAAIGELMNGRIKPGKLPIEPMVRLIAYTRAEAALPNPPSDQTLIDAICKALDLKVEQGWLCWHWAGPNGYGGGDLVETDTALKIARAALAQALPSSPPREPAGFKEALQELLDAQEAYATASMAEDNATTNYSGNTRKYANATSNALARVSKAEKAARAMLAVSPQGAPDSSESLGNETESAGEAVQRPSAGD